MSTNDPIPWNLIAKQWRNGSSLDALSARFGVSIDQLKAKLSSAYDSERLDIRSDAQIKAVGLEVKSDLTTALANLARNLASNEQISLRDAPALDRLINCAARLFQWPVPKSIVLDQNNNGLSLGLGTQNAINLALIRTTPEQLKAISQANHENSSGQSTP